MGPDLPELKSLLGAPGMGAGRMIMELERAGKTHEKKQVLGGGDALVIFYFVISWVVEGMRLANLAGYAGHQALFYPP